MSKYKFFTLQTKELLVKKIVPKFQTNGNHGISNASKHAAQSYCRKREKYPASKCIRVERYRKRIEK